MEKPVKKTAAKKKMEMMEEECCGGGCCDMEAQGKDDCCGSGACSGGSCEGGACRMGGSCGGCGDKASRCPMMRMMHGHKPGKMFVAFSAGLLFLMSAIFVGVQIWGNPWFKNIKAEITAQPYARTITVDGEGKISAKPDIAKISFSVVSKGKTVKVVTDDGNKKMNAVLAELKKLGIKPEDMQTSGYDLYPEYFYPPVVDYGKPAPSPQITGYNLTQTVDVKIRDLTKSDDALSVAVNAGANQVGSLVFDLDDASAVKGQAREKAFQAAKEKAQQMAKAAGVNLGRVVTFSESYNPGPIPYANFAMKEMSVGAAPEAAPTVEAGSKEINMNVSVTYEIE